MKRHPVVKWRDIDKDIFFRRSKAIAEAAEEAELGDQSDDSSTEADLEEDHGVLAEVPATTFIVEELADLDSRILLDLLSDAAAASIQREDRGESTSQATEPSTQDSDPSFDLDREISEW
jgi:hypothetical protein